MEALSNFLKDDVGISSPYIVKNGSGLNPDNRFSASQIVKILDFSFRNFTIFPEILASLPISGLDGTLKDRFEKFPITVRAKTGTLTEPITVSTIAGYIFHPKHHFVAFAVLANGNNRYPNANLIQLRYDQEQHLLKIYNKL